MTDAPKGFVRGDDGVLRLDFTGSIFERRPHIDPGEADLFPHAEKLRFGCTESCFSHYRSHACGNTAKFDPDANGNPTKCGHHSAAAIKRKKERMRSKDKAAREARERQSALSALNSEKVQIIEKIAAGHNDPRGLCVDWMDRYSALKGDT